MGTLAQPSEEVSVTRPSFWQIADDLAAYTETLLMVEAEIETEANVEPRSDTLQCLDEQRVEVLASIDRLGAELATKTDSIAGVLRRLDSDAAMQREEAERMAAKAKASERAAAWLKEYVIKTMDEHGWKHLKTPRNTLAIRGNGGVQPLVIDDPEKIPDAQCYVEGKIQADFWADIVAWLEKTGYNVKSKFDTRWQLGFTNRVPSNTLIREALAGECQRCGGAGDIWIRHRHEPGDVEEEGHRETCEACNGTGRASVPGARLTERGRHLRLA
jgi:Siphovirus Gp157